MYNLVVLTTVLSNLIPYRTKWKRQTAVGFELLSEAGNFIAVQRILQTNPYWAYHPATQSILASMKDMLRQQTVPLNDDSGIDDSKHCLESGNRSQTSDTSEPSETIYSKSNMINSEQCICAQAYQGSNSQITYSEHVKRNEFPDTGKSNNLQKHSGPSVNKLQPLMSSTGFAAFEQMKQANHETSTTISSIPSFNQLTNFTNRTVQSTFNDIEQHCTEKSISHQILLAAATRLLNMSVPLENRP